MHQHHLGISSRHLAKYRPFTHDHIETHKWISHLYTYSDRLVVMYAMSLTRLYMYVIPVLDIRGMLPIYPPSLNHIFKLNWPWMHEHQVMTQQCTFLYDLTIIHLYITHLYINTSSNNISLYDTSSNNTFSYTS